MFFTSVIFLGRVHSFVSKQGANDIYVTIKTCNVQRRLPSVVSFINIDAFIKKKVGED